MARDDQSLNLLALTFEKTDPPAGHDLPCLRRRRARAARRRMRRGRAPRHRLPQPASEACPGHALTRRRRRFDGPEEISMAIELDMQRRRISSRASQALLGAKREVRGRRRRRRRGHHRRRARARRRGARRLHAGASTASTSQRTGLGDRAPPKSTRRSRPAIPRALKRLNSPMRGCSPTIDARSRPTSALPTRSGSSSAGAGARSMRSGSMCPAARQAIPPRW